LSLVSRYRRCAQAMLAVQTNLRGRRSRREHHPRALHGGLVWILVAENLFQVLSVSSPPGQFDPTSPAQYGHLSVIGRNLVGGFLTGGHKSPYKGFSVEFAEHRQYYPGDEIRHIDWRAYGKTDRYYIKEYEEETNLQAHLLVDASGSMAYQGGNAS